MSGCSAVGSAQRLGRWGRWFESSHPDHPFLLSLSATTNMDQPADLRAQATELRRQGFSYSQIGRRLGVHKSVIARWVAAVSFDGFNDESPVPSSSVPSVTLTSITARSSCDRPAGHTR